jgi:exodeoxyribonuclease-3
LKAPEEKLPVAALKDAGYQGIWLGQKSWNGVAVLSRNEELKLVRNALPGDPEDIQSRYLEVIWRDIRICGLYLPNGNPVPGPKFDYKLAWMERLIERAQELLNTPGSAILLGDFNIIPTEKDVYKPERWVEDALFRPESRAAFQRLLDQGWTDALRHLHPDQTIYTFWDYFRNAYQRDAGLRIDHFLLTPNLIEKLEAAGVDRQVRGWEKSSDHGPVWIELAQ